jgi:hypothetical protein
MKKRGQFYLIAAMIIIVILVGLIGFINYTSFEKEDSMKDLQKGLENEITYTMDYGAAHNLDSSEFKTIFKNLSSIYINKTNDKTSIFIYGESSGTIVAKGKNSENSNISININGTELTLQNGIGEFEENYILAGNLVYFNISENQYSFELSEGQNFKYFIAKGKGKEKIIIQG